MPEFLIDPEIARLEETRQAEGTAEMVRIGRDTGETPDAAVEPVGGGWMCFAGKGSWANQAAGLGLDGVVTDVDLDRLVEFYVTRGVEPKIEVAACVDPSLIDGLGARGFRVLEFENVLVRRLDATTDFRALMPHPWPPDVSIEPVDRTDPNAVYEFALASTSGFRPANEPIPEPLLQSTRNMMRQSRCCGYVARVDGVAVGGAAMDASPDVAALCGTSVDVSLRKRGIQTALMVRRLEAACDLGCRFAAVHSRPGIPTERNALRIGFALAYTKAIMVMPGDGLDRSP